MGCHGDKKERLSVHDYIGMFLLILRNFLVRESIVALEGAFEIAEKWKNKSNEQVNYVCTCN